MSYIYRVDITGLDSSGVATVFRYATEGYATSPSHPTLPNTVFEGRVSQPLLFRRDLYGQGRTYGTVNTGHGTSELQNSDGALDGLRLYGFDTQLIEVWRISRSALDTETLVFRGHMEQLTLDVDKVTILVRDPTYTFHRTLQATKYAGTNVLPAGVEGTANDIKGQPKPICWGVNPNLQPVLVNTSRLIYQVHDVAPSTGWSLTVYDSRVALTAGAAYANQADMQANAPAAGTYRVCTDGGFYFRVGSSPVGTVTCDVTNPAPSATSSWADILYALLNRAGSITLDNDVDPTVTFAVGVYWTEEITVYDAVREVLASINGSFQIYPNTVGATPVLVTAARLELPAASAVLELDYTNIIGDVRLVYASDPERGIPPWRITCRYQRNRTVMDDGQLAGSVSAADLAFVAAEYRALQADNSGVKTQFPAAPEMIFDTGLTSNTDANSHLTGYLRPTYATPRALFSVAIPVELLHSLVSAGPTPIVPGLMLGQTLKLTFPRFGLNSGRFLTLIGFSVDYSAGLAELLLWGAVA